MTMITEIKIYFLMLSFASFVHDVSPVARLSAS